MDSKQPDEFSAKVWRVLGFTALTLGGLLLIWLSMGVLLLVFAGLLLAIMLHGLSRRVTHHTRLPNGAALAVVAVGLALFLLSLAAFTGNRLTLQAETFFDQVPRISQRFLERARKSPLAMRLLDLGDGKSSKGSDDADDAATQPATQPETAASTEPATQPTSQAASSANALATVIKKAVPSVASRLPSVFGAATDAIVSFLVVFVVGIYVAAAPRVYIEGLVYLVPEARRHRARQTIVAVVYTLRSWMLGQSISMGAVGLMTGIGLYFVGINLWLLFAVLAALFNFIPNFGALISFVPAVLVAWGDDPTKAIWVTVVYAIAQGTEGYLITPMVQRRASEVPPALLIVSQVLMGTLGGLLAIMLAAPLTAATLVAVKMLYVEDTLGDDVTTPDDTPQVKDQVQALEQK